VDTAGRCLPNFFQCASRDTFLKCQSCVRVLPSSRGFGNLGNRLIVYTLQVVENHPFIPLSQSNSFQPRANRNADNISTGQSVVRRTPDA
jgi:hypothetical protein